MDNFNNTSDLAWLQFIKKREEYQNLTERDEAALFAQCVELQVLTSKINEIKSSEPLHPLIMHEPRNQSQRNTTEEVL